MALKYPSIKPHDGKKLWRLLEMFEIDVPGLGLVRVMAGFVLDFGSIPPWAWPIVGHPLCIVCLVAYLIHDALYSAKLVSRKQADYALLYLLRLYKANPARRAAIYSVVRVFGCFPWMRRRAGAARAARRYVHLH